MKVRIGYKMKRNKETLMRIDKTLLNRLAKLKLPIKKDKRNIESFAEVIERLLRKHYAELKKDQRNAIR